MNSSVTLELIKELFGGGEKRICVAEGEVGLGMR